MELAVAVFIGNMMSAMVVYGLLDFKRMRDQGKEEWEARWTTFMTILAPLGMAILVLSAYL